MNDVDSTLRDARARAAASDRHRKSTERAAAAAQQRARRAKLALKKAKKTSKKARKAARKARQAADAANAALTKAIARVSRAKDDVVKPRSARRIGRTPSATENPAMATAKKPAPKAKRAAAKTAPRKAAKKKSVRRASVARTAKPARQAVATPSATESASPVAIPAEERDSFVLGNSDLP